MYAGVYARFAFTFSMRTVLQCQGQAPTHAACASTAAVERKRHQHAGDDALCCSSLHKNAKCVVHSQEIGPVTHAVTHLNIQHRQPQLCSCASSVYCLPTGMALTGVRSIAPPKLRPATTTDRRPTTTTTTCMRVAWGPSVRRCSMSLPHTSASACLPGRYSNVWCAQPVAHIGACLQLLSVLLPA